MTTPDDLLDEIMVTISNLTPEELEAFAANTGLTPAQWLEAVENWKKEKLQ